MPQLYMAVKVMDFIHFKGGGVAGGIYRVIIGVGMMGLVISGSMVFFMIQARRHVK